MQRHAAAPRSGCSGTLPALPLPALLSHFIKYCEEIRLLPLPASAKHIKGWSAPRSRHAAAPRSSTYIITRKTAVFEMRVQNFFCKTTKNLPHRRQFCLARRALYLFSFSCFFSFSSAFALSFSSLKKKKRGVWGERKRSAGSVTLHPDILRSSGSVVLSAPLCSSVTQLPERGAAA